jgi:hypothetical protein
MGGLAHLRCTFRRPLGSARGVVSASELSAYITGGRRGTGITARLTRTPGIGTSADYAAAIVESAKRPAATSIPE